jgi:regulator of protease activity HflC (stomatin/prohibitin superfamily)
MFFSPYGLYVIPIVLLTAFVLIAASAMILPEYERAVVFILGRFQRSKRPQAHRR